MKLADLYNLSTRMFRTRPTRTWLTVLGIGVGIGAVLFLVSLGYGLQNIILQKIVFNDALLSLTITPGTDLIILDNKAVDDILKIPNVTEVSPLAKFTGQMAVGDLNGTTAIRGINANFFSFSGTTAKDGKVFSEDDGRQIVVSEAILKLFGVKEPKEIIGKEISLKIFLSNSSTNQSAVEIFDVPDKFVVKGTVEDSQESYIFMQLKEISSYVNVNSYEQARVKVNDSKNLQAVKDVLLTNGYQIQSLSDTIEQANKIFQVIQITLGLFGAVALVVSAIGMFNTMTVTLLERTNEIGIMRALGASKGNLRNLFLSESIMIGFLGGLVGIVLGIIAGQITNLVVNTLAARFGGSPTNLFAYPGWFMGVILFLSITIGFFSGVFPARRAAAMDPLEALRYK